MPKAREPVGDGAVRRSLILVATAIVAAGVFVASPSAQGAHTPNRAEYHALTFPVQEAVHYFDDFGGARNHPGNDLMGAKLMHLLAPAA
jgi:hypothetical protein